MSTAVDSLAAPADRPGRGRTDLDGDGRAWYSCCFLFEEAGELLLRDEAALLRAWLKRRRRCCATSRTFRARRSLRLAAYC